MCLTRNYSQSLPYQQSNPARNIKKDAKILFFLFLIRRRFPSWKFSLRKMSLRKLSLEPFSEVYFSWSIELFMWSWNIVLSGLSFQIISWICWTSRSSMWYIFNTFRILYAHVDAHQGVRNISFRKILIIH